MSVEALDVVKQDELGGERPGALDEKQWAVLKYTDEMTRNVQVDDATFAQLKGLFTDKEVVEITATVSDAETAFIECEANIWTGRGIQLRQQILGRSRR